MAQPLVAAPPVSHPILALASKPPTHPMSQVPGAACSLPPVDSVLPVRVCRSPPLSTTLLSLVIAAAASSSDLSIVSLVDLASHTGPHMTLASTGLISTCEPPKHGAHTRRSSLSDADTLVSSASASTRVPLVLIPCRPRCNTTLSPSSNAVAAEAVRPLTICHDLLVPPPLYVVAAVAACERSLLLPSTPIIVRTAPPFSSSPEARCGIQVICALVVAVTVVYTAYLVLVVRLSARIAADSHSESVWTTVVILSFRSHSHIYRVLSRVSFLVSCFLLLLRRLGLVRVRRVRVVWAWLGSDRIGLL